MRPTGTSVLLLFMFAGCARVPAEAVQLSYTVGEDLEVLHVSYKALIKEHFDGIRFRWNDYIDNRWTPEYLKNFIREGRLVEAARGDDPEEVFLTVKIWAETATKTVRKKRAALLSTINDKEARLNLAVDEAFARVMRANAMVTAHLSSLKKVQDVQDKTLEAFKLKDLRDEINQGLIDASNMVARGIEITERGGDIVEELDATRQRVTDIARQGDDDE